MSTRSQLRGKFRTEIKIDPNGKVWSDSVANQFINSAYFQVQKDWNFKWRANDGNYTVSLVSWTQEYTLPTGFIRTDLVRYNGSDLYPTDKVTLKQRYQSFVNGTPSQYYLYGSFIGLDVIPNVTGTLDIDYRKQLTAFTADADVSGFPEDMDDLMIKYASYLAWSTAKGNEQTAQIKLQDYKMMLDTMLASYIYDISNPRFSTSRGWYSTGARVLDR